MRPKEKMVPDRDLKWQIEMCLNWRSHLQGVKRNMVAEISNLIELMLPFTIDK